MDDEEILFFEYQQAKNHRKLWMPALLGCLILVLVSIPIIVYFTEDSQSEVKFIIVQNNEQNPNSVSSKHHIEKKVAKEKTEPRAVRRKKKPWKGNSKEKLKDNREIGSQSDRQILSFFEHYEKENCFREDQRNKGFGKQCEGISDEWRFDCHPEDDATQNKCESRGCCWANPQKEAPKSQGSTGIPYCFYPTDYPGYYIVNNSETEHGYILFIERNTSSYYPNDIKLLRVDVILYENDITRIKIYDPVKTRYEIPYSIHLRNTKNAQSNFTFEFNCNSFGIKITNKETNQIILQTNQVPIIYTDQFIQFSTLTSNYVYGLGERRDHLLRSLDWQRIVMFAAGEPPIPNENLYGSHPFMLYTMEKGISIGILLYNSNAMEAVLQPTPAVTFRTLGGIIDVVVFTGFEPADVIRKYLQTIGLPTMPPYWSLGFHLSRFGLKSDKETRKLWQRTRDANIPFDVQWNDIDYMDSWKDFTYDKNKFAGLPALVDDIHKANMHYIVIIDAALDTPSDPSVYPPYSEALNRGILINDTNGKPFIGTVWTPNGAAWPDFTNPATTNYWIKQIKSFHDQIPVDGLWIDMNEPTNFYNGTKLGCPSSEYENPPYVPHVIGGKLSYQTLCMTAKQYEGLHYNVHNLYGYSESIATNKALRTILPGKRPFIISRSTFPGYGHYGGHWTGDIASTWDDLKYSIPAILEFNMFGIPMVGADICGFKLNTTVELCTRWMQLGAFYPFSRNHNSNDTIDQDPVALGQLVIDVSITALSFRYMLLPYLYTLFYRANVYGDTVARPLFFEFATDKNTFNIDTQFLWGASLMILPVLEANQTTVKAYFPKGKWILAYDSILVNSSGQWMQVDSPLQIIKFAIREGSILPLKYSDPQIIPKNTLENRKQPFSLYVFQNESGFASGELFWDDGELLDTVESGAYNLIKFIATPFTVRSVIIKAGAIQQLQSLERIQVVNISKEPKAVFVDKKKVEFHYEDSSKFFTAVVNITSFAEPFEMTWQM